MRVCLAAGEPVALSGGGLPTGRLFGRRLAVLGPSIGRQVAEEWPSRDNQLGGHWPCAMLTGSRPGPGDLRPPKAESPAPAGKPFPLRDHTPKTRSSSRLLLPGAHTALIGSGPIPPPAGRPPCLTLCHRLRNILLPVGASILPTFWPAPTQRPPHCKLSGLPHARRAAG